MLQRESNFKKASGYSKGSSTDAWHNIMTSDPLIDSDEESPDEHTRLDYCQLLLSVIISFATAEFISPARRLDVLSRLQVGSPG
jgi:hypothetical protein